MPEPNVDLNFLGQRMVELHEGLRRLELRFDEHQHRTEDTLVAIARTLDKMAQRLATIQSELTLVTARLRAMEPP